MSLEQITQHRELAVIELAPPFQGKPRIASLLCAFVSRLQDIEDDLWEILTERTIDNADLVRLKVLGKLVGQPRHGFATEDFRTLIRARARANRSHGTSRDIRDVLTILVGAGQYLVYTPGDATLVLIALQPLSAEGIAMAAEVLPDTRAAGVGLALLSSTEADAGVRGFYPAGGAASAGSFLFESLTTPGGGTAMLGVTNL